MRCLSIDNRAEAAQEFDSLKSIRYEDTQDGVPPLPVSSVAVPPRSSSQAALRTTESPKQSPVSPAFRIVPLSEEKRDSGIAPSVATIGHTSYAESQGSAAAAGVARESTLPTIVVQHDESPEPIERNELPSDRFGRDPMEQSNKSQTKSPCNIQRINSFKGIQAEIPSGSIGDIEFGDLASDKVGFSHRGSLLFGGKKMNALIAAQDDGLPSSNSVVSPVASPDIKASDISTGDGQREGEPEPVRRGLVSGRRKPSVHMLQAALSGGRVLSAEEISLSMKVRSMYEHGDERAADWTTSMATGLSGYDTLETSTIDATMESLTVDEATQSVISPGLRATSAASVRSGYTKEPNETAGGIEDWENVEYQDVDRYGFIVPKPASSRPSTNSTNQQREGLHRVATALQVEAAQQRRERGLHRGLSRARSSRSVPPQSRRDETHSKAPSSMHSFRSSDSRHSSAIHLPSRTRRTLAEAANMLSLPPALADIEEQENAGKTASMLKRREWSREEKWRKMAKPVRQRSSSKGGGMQFEFDTRDAKLINRTWKGIPDRWRATAWHSFLSSSARRRGFTTSDEELIAEFYRLQDLNCADDVQIDVDVPRTISMHVMFRRRYRGGQRLLFRVLHAISLYCPEPGYVQGMASLAATLLCYYDEALAFVMLARLWRLRGLEQLFQLDRPEDGLMAALAEFQRDWLRDGDVARRLETLGVPPTSYGTRWYLTLFNLSIPFPAQLRVWDVFMLLGDASPAAGKDGIIAPFGGADLDVLHATSAALIDATRSIILDADFENTMKVLTSFVPIKDDDILMRVARTEYRMRKKRAGGKV